MRWNPLAGLSIATALVAVAAFSPIHTAMAEAIPSEIAPKAVRSVLTDVTHTGKRFVAVGDRGHVLLSDDGQNWTQVVSPVSRMLTAVYFVNEQTGWAVGYDLAIIKTNDGGETWALQNHDAEQGWPFYNVFFINAQRGFAMGERGTLMVTDNGGSSWDTIENDITDLGMHINAMIRLANGILIAVGEKGLVIRSNDEGANWEMVTEPYVGSFFGIVPRGKNGFVTFGLRGNAFATDDASALLVQDPLEWDEYGRETVIDPERLTELGWRFLENDITESLFGGTSLPDGEVVMVGVNGSIARTDTSAGRLVPVPNPGDTTLGSVVVNNGNLIMVGVAGISRLSIR